MANRPDQTFEKLSWYEAPPFHYVLLLTCALLFLSVLIAALAGWFINRSGTLSARQVSRLAGTARWLMALVAALLAVPIGLFAVVAWKNGYWGRLARVHYTVVALGAFAFIWFLNCWNLLGWRVA